jgi:ubiquinone/menaquinone biosynthesis C-methylase UbiE
VRSPEGVRAQQREPTGAEPGEVPNEDSVRREWPHGSSAGIAAATTIVAELLCERIDLRPDQIVLDVATGSGNGALAAARRGCEVRGVDRVPALLDRARERARAERLRAGFQLGDAEDVPFPDASFDVVLSVFGVTFAADPQQAASELLRVCRPGGTIALASWTLESVIGTLFRRVGGPAGRVQGLSGSTIWATEHGIRSLLATHTLALAARRRTFVFRCKSPDNFLELMHAYYSSAVTSFGPADQVDESAVVHALTQAVQQFNRAEDHSLIVPSEYLEVVATKR